MTLTKATYSMLATAPASVDDYGAVGDNVANDRAAFTAALAASNWVRLTPGKLYFLGNVTSASPIFSITGSNKGIDFNGAAVRVNTTGNYNAPLFQLDNLNGFTLLNPVISDSGYDPAVPVNNKGITAINFNCLTGIVRNVWVMEAKFNTLVSPVGVTDATYAAENIWFYADVYNCYYGFNLANNGHNVTADYRTYNVVRSYFCYGVHNHVINCVSSNHNAIGNADFLIKCKETARPTRCINANFVSINSQASTNPQLVFESQNDTGDAAIFDCTINYNDAQSPLVVDSIAFRHYNDAGVLQATDPNTKTRLRVNGFASGTVTYSSVPTAAQDQNFDGCLGLLPTFNAYKSATSLNVTGDGTAYDVVFDTQLSDYTDCYNAGNGIFTAPRDGFYTFSARALIQDRTGSQTRVDFRLVTTPKTFYNTSLLSSGIPIPENSLEVGVSRVYLKKNETSKVVLFASGGTKTIDLYGDSGNIATYFSGGLVTGSPKSP